MIEIFCLISMRKSKTVNVSGHDNNNFDNFDNLELRLSRR